MPFARVFARASRGLPVNPKKIDAKFMAVGFDTTPIAHKHLAAGLHPFDNQHGRK